jgi:hypothetical protein
MTLNDALLKVGVYYCISPFQALFKKSIIRIEVRKVNRKSSTITENGSKKFECAHGDWDEWVAFTNYWHAYAESLKREAEYERDSVHS